MAMVPLQISPHNSQGRSSGESMLVTGHPPSMPLLARRRSLSALTMTDWTGDRHQTTALSLSSQVANIGPSASRLAWQNHIAKLTETERDLFLRSQTGGIGGYVTAIEAASKKQGKNSRAMNISGKLDPLFKALNMYAPIAQTLVQADPSPSAFVLGGITCILSIPSRFHEYQVKIVEILSEMGDELTLLFRYEKEIYQADAHVQKSLIDLYGGVLDFCREASKLLYDESGSPKSTLKTFVTSIWQPFQSKLGAIAQRFKENVEIFEASARFADRRNEKIFRAMATQSMMYHYQDNQTMIGNLSFISQRLLADAKRSEVQESATRNVELHRTQEEKRNRILAWVPSVSFLNDHHDKISKRLVGTGQWLLEHRRLQAWKSNTHSDILFVQGKSGCGKSCLAALVIDTLLKELEGSCDKIAVAFVYCSSMDAEKANPYQLQGSILKQLCSQVPNHGVIPTIEKMFEKNQGEAPTPDQLEKAISAVSASFSQTFIVVDGLDECHRLEDGNFDRFCKFVRWLAEPKPSLVKVMIFSRPGYRLMDQAFRSYPHLVVDSGANEGDIKLFITNVVSGEELHIRKNQTLLKDVEKELLLKANGMFLWVGLLVQTLKAARTAKEIKAKMNALPQGLPGVYELSLRRILDQKDEFSRERALMILLWVTNAKRALSREELAEALSIEPGMCYLDEGNVVEGDDGITAECGDLIVLRDGNYHLLHSSLHDYLSNLPVLSSDNLEDYRAMQINADKILAEACLTYLQFNKFRAGPLCHRQELEDFQRNNPFFKYAASYWGRHVAAASETEFQDTVRSFVCSDELRELSMQQFILATDTYDFEFVCPYPGSTTPLHILSIFNLVRIAESIPDLLQLRLKRCGFNFLPLHYALLEKASHMCLWLLQEPGNSIMTADSIAGLSLSLAAKNDWGEVIERLISFGYDPEQSVGDGKQTPLHVAAVHGCESALNVLLKANVNVDPIDAQNTTPLLDAAKSNHNNLMSLLLRAGANVNHRSKQDLTAIHIVTRKGNLPAARQLFQYGSEVDPGAGIWKSLTPLHMAASKNRTEIMRLLLSKGAQIEAKDKFGFTPLLTACISGSLASLDLLISSRARVDARNASGCTALHLAAYCGHIDVSEALLKVQNGLLDANDEEGDTPLHTAIKGHQTQTALLLLKCGASVEMPNTDGHRALHLAIVEGNADLVELLVTDYKASLTAKTSLGSIPLHYASKFGHSSYIKWLIGDDCVHAGALNSNLQSALHLASREKDYIFIKELARLATNLDFAPRDKWGQSPLHDAAYVGATDIVRFLLKRNVLGTKDSDGNLPIHLAAQSGHLDAVKILLTKENIDSRGFFGRTALFGAASQGHLELVRFLLRSGANPNELDEFDEGPLLTALTNKHSQIAELLLDMKADPNSGDKFGRTPLYRAAGSGNIKLTKRLLEDGCDGLHKSIWGDTPFTCAVSSNRVELVDLFLQQDYNGSNVSGNIGVTEYNIAASNGNVEMFKKLVETGKAVGADLGTSDVLGCNAMVLAAEGGHVELLDCLVELGLSVNGPDQASRPPIWAAVAGGNVAFVSRLLELKADVNVFDKRENRTPLIAAAACRRPRIFQKLLCSGANPLQWDVYGLNALDYAFRTPEIWETLNEAKRAYKQLDQSARKTTVENTVRARISSLLKLSPDLTPEGEAERLDLMRTLAYALLALGDDINHEAALVCFSELGNPLEFCQFKVHWQCDICMQTPIIGRKYVCTQCCDVDLCQECHSDYLQGAGIPKSAPPALRVLEELENDLQPIRRVIGAYVHFGAAFLAEALGLLTLVDDWIEKIVKAWDNWEEEFNDEQRFEIDAFPGGKFLKLIERTHQIRKVLETKDVDVNGARKADRGEFPNTGTERNLEEKDDNMSGENPEEDMNPFLEVDESLTQLFRDFRPDREILPFACVGHDYLEVPSIDWTKTDSSTGPFDVNGRVTERWLLELLARCNTNQVRESPTWDAEPSGMEMKELQNHTGPVQRVNNPAKSIPIGTATISELDGVIHNTPPTILKPIDAASVVTDTSIKKESTDRENSALDALADDTAIRPLSVSSCKCTLDILSKAADASIPPGDARRSVPSCDLVTVNGASSSIGERALPGNQRAEGLEQIMANQQRIQAIRKELHHALAECFLLILAPHDDSEDEESNTERKKDSEEDDARKSARVMARICVFQLAFKFAQVILLGEVKEKLFSGDELERLLLNGEMLEEGADAGTVSENGERGD